MLQLSNEIFEGCNRNEITTIVTLDQSAAFDVLAHETLMAKLKLYNFSQETLSWIARYLNYRSQYVNTRDSKYWTVDRDQGFQILDSFKYNTNSVCGTVVCHKNSGLVLGPILYVLYMPQFGLNALSHK